MGEKDEFMPDAETAEYVSELSGLTKYLASQGRLIFLLTISNFLLSVANGVVFFLHASRSDLIVGDVQKLVILIGQIFLLLFVVANLWRYEGLKQRANILFEEISDELQWWVTRSQRSGNSEKGTYLVPPKIELRVILREYAFSANLPFTRDERALRDYLTMNLFALLLSVMFWVTSSTLFLAA